ncbi:unnamed protein product [Arabis nemorensis]|uniref:Phytocyanin domain-containing protein n=1 Tax=Arabis nemorensis TaxID=586526 RepID=A0A565AY38_9BRAS|nr:unnamed protein product [Arabis nemorensis]
MGTIMMWMSLVIMIVAAMIGGGCGARVYKVGENGGGWTVYKDREYYHQWTEDKHLFVGDSLVFEYDKITSFFDFNDDDVTEVTGRLEFEYCDPTSAKAVHKTGHDIVTFTEPGIHYFINSAPGRCYAGQKLRVFVLSDPSCQSNIPKPINVPSSGKVYKVGDSNGWTAKADPMWYEGKHFEVGFGQRCTSGSLEVQFCDASSPLAVYNTGYDIVKLTRPGSYYFISSKPGLCAAGLQLDVLVTPKDSPNQANLRSSLPQN